jgi:hypothetical protein
MPKLNAVEWLATALPLLDLPLFSHSRARERTPF